MRSNYAKHSTMHLFEYKYFNDKN